MNDTQQWHVDQTQILSSAEMREVLADLRRRARRYPNARLQRTVFRLAACCGLRASEIAGLIMADVKLSKRRPYIQIRKSVGKGGKARRVPLWWDGGTLADIEAWVQDRKQHGAGMADPLICRMRKDCYGQGMTRQEIWSRFRSAIKCLGEARLETLSTHSGRHSFVSHALAAGRSLAEVRDAAGHASIATTSIYTHVAVDDGDEVGEIW